MSRTQRSLIIAREGSEPTELHLEPGVYLIGREEGNNLIIDHPSIAPRHCELTVFADGGLVVRPLTAECETSIDGIPIGVSGLGPGQRLRLGEVDCWVADAEVSKAGEDSPATGQRPSYPESEVGQAAIDQDATTPSSPSDFWSSLSGALLYPVRGDGWIPLLFLVGVSNVTRFLPGAIRFIDLGIGLLVGAYLIQLAKTIVLTTGENPDAPFPNPDVSFHPDDLREAALSMIGLTMVCFGPAILLEWVPVAPAWMKFGFIALGCLYLPMALLAMIVTDHFGAVSPTMVIPSIFRAPFPYSIVAASLGVLLAASALVNSTSFKTSAVGGVGLALSVASSAIGFYLLITWLRMLGLFFHHHRNQLAQQFSF
ncbi:MAG: FHA domain-containing protein [Verrucomicrobiales bacterium]|nr:FHA domain-containing protein [Verrucomicrobiales bacterium]